MASRKMEAFGALPQIEEIKQLEARISKLEVSIDQHAAKVNELRDRRQRLIDEVKSRPEYSAAWRSRTKPHLT